MSKKKVVIIGAILLLSGSGAMAQMRPGARAVLQCRIKACMKEHLPELSDPCKEGLFQAWLKQ
jgi:hypothetical protein